MFPIILYAESFPHKGKHISIILELYSIGIVPSQGTALINLTNYHTDKLLPGKFHVVDTKMK